MPKRRFARSLLALYLVLGSWRGYLAIYEGDNAEPRQIFPRKIEQLSPSDRDALVEGIVVRSDRRLRELLDDYLS